MQPNAAATAHRLTEGDRYSIATMAATKHPPAPSSNRIDSGNRKSYCPEVSGGLYGGLSSGENKYQGIGGIFRLANPGRKSPLRSRG